MINRYVTVAFSAELAGTDGQQMLDVENLQEENGSVGCSPSATAYFALQVRKEDSKAMAYLYEICKKNGGAPNVAPFDVFEIAWTLWNLSLIPEYRSLIDTAQRHIKLLSHVWDTGNGAGFSSEYSINDGDETAIVFDTLSRYGLEKNVGQIHVYEENDYFRCFDLESDPSISANIHILSALRQGGYEKCNPSIRKILQFLQKTKNSDGYWNDKWHISPYYATSHMIIACADYANEMVSDAVSWLIRTQKQDGSWGIFNSTAEETAYALQALWFWDQKVEQVPPECLHKGKVWLEDHQDDYSPLWIGKCLYSPKLVIKSAILSALTSGKLKNMSIINRLITIPTSDPDDARRRKLLNILLLGIAVLLVLAISFVLVVIGMRAKENRDITGIWQIFFASTVFIVGMIVIYF